jgi:hypothetical protein
MLPSPSPPVLLQRLPDGGVLFDATTEVYYSLNSVGARVWELLADGVGSLDDLCLALLDEYPDADLVTVQADVEELLAELTRFGFLTPGPIAAVDATP